MPQILASNSLAPFHCGMMRRPVLLSIVRFVLAVYIASSARPSEPQLHKSARHVASSLIEVASEEAISSGAVSNSPEQISVQQESVLSGASSATVAIETAVGDPSDAPAKVMREVDVAQEHLPWSRTEASLGSDQKHTVMTTGPGVDGVELTAKPSGLVQAVVAGDSALGDEARGDANLFQAKPDVLGLASFVQLDMEDGAAPQWHHHAHHHNTGTAMVHDALHHPSTIHRRSHSEQQHMSQEQRTKRHPASVVRQSVETHPQSLSESGNEESYAGEDSPSVFSEAAALQELASDGEVLDDDSLTPDAGNAKIQALEQELMQAREQKLQAEINVIRASTPNIQNMTINSARNLLPSPASSQVLIEQPANAAPNDNAVAALRSTASATELEDASKASRATDEGDAEQREKSGSLIDNSAKESQEDSDSLSDVHRVLDEDTTVDVEDRPSASKEALDAFQGCQGPESMHAGEKGLQALRDCVDTLEKYAQLAREQRSVSEQANDKYRSAFNTATDMLQLWTAKHRALEASYVQDQHRAYQTLGHRITDIAKQLEQMESQGIGKAQE